MVRSRAARRTAASPPGRAQAAPVGPAAIGPPFVFPTGPILETDFVNTEITDHRGNWTKRKVPGGKVFYDPRGPKYGYMNLHHPDDQYDNPLTGLSGTIVDTPRRSGSDLPFLHPYDNDFEFLVAPDPPYAELVGPTMINGYATGTTTAQQEFGLPVDGVVGLEWDNDMVPSAYQPVKGDRTCLFGRLIVDAGHDDFHTEIHPPLLMVTGHPQRSQFQARGARKKDATVCRFIARPFLVSQDFGGHGLPGHLIIELGKVIGFLSFGLEAHPRLLPPFVGQNFMMFKIRPPEPRKDPRDQLIVTAQVTRRSNSVAIQLLPGTDSGSLRVLVVLNDASYDPPPEPPRRNRRIKLAEFAGLDPVGGTLLFNAVNAAFPVLPGHAQVIVNLGIETHFYTALPAPPLGNAITMDAKRLRPLPQPVDTSHPFPVAGLIKVEWKRFGVAAPPGPVAPAGTG
jgi:hypothetical protein